MTTTTDRSVTRAHSDDSTSRTFVLDVPRDEYGTARDAGATWDTALKAHRFDGTELPSALEAFRAQPYSLEADTERELAGESITEHIATSVITPYPHQRAAAFAIRLAWDAGYPGFLLADDVGLGKTITALLAALDVESAQTIVIVCPLSVIPHWRHTIRALGDRGKRIILLNYERVGKLFDAPPAKPSKRRISKRTRNKRLASKGTLRFEPDLVILDEAHKCRSPATGIARFSARLVAASPFTLWLSATAGQNPLELSYLAPLLAAVTGSTAKDLAAYELWCQAQGIGVTRGAYGRWQWDATSDHAEDDLLRLHGILFNGDVPAGIRRRPENIVGWPEITRITYPVALNSDARTLYEKAWHDFRRALQLSRTRPDSRNAMTAFLRFRQKASLLRVSGTVAMITEMLEQDRQVAVSITFLESLGALREALESLGIGVATYTGRQSSRVNEAERLRFQRGDTSVMLFTTVEGFSLHAGELTHGGTLTPRATVLHDVRLNAIESAQVEGRAHRDGNHAPVYYMYGDNTVEQGIIARVITRLAQMKVMVGDDTTTLREIEAFLRAEAGVDGDSGPDLRDAGEGQSDSNPDTNADVGAASSMKKSHRSNAVSTAAVDDSAYYFVSDQQPPISGVQTCYACNARLLVAAGDVQWVRDRSIFDGYDKDVRTWPLCRRCFAENEEERRPQWVVSSRDVLGAVYLRPGAEGDGGTRVEGTGVALHMLVSRSELVTIARTGEVRLDYARCDHLTMTLGAAPKLNPAALIAALCLRWHGPVDERPAELAEMRQGVLYVDPLLLHGSGASAETPRNAYLRSPTWGDLSYAGAVVPPDFTRGFSYTSGMGFVHSFQAATAFWSLRIRG